MKAVTFEKLAGAEIPADCVIDGEDIWPVLADLADVSENSGPAAFVKKPKPLSK